MPKSSSVLKNAALLGNKVLTIYSTYNPEELVVTEKFQGGLLYWMSRCWVFLIGRLVFQDHSVYWSD